MHGLPSVPQEWLKIINDHGGQIKETYGVPLLKLLKVLSMVFVKLILIRIYV